MDVRDCVAASAAGFSPAAYLLKSGFPVAEVWETRGLPAVYAHWPAAAETAPREVGLDADRIHAPNEYVDLSRLLVGAETAAYLWDELAATGSGSR